MSDTEKQPEAQPQSKKDILKGIEDVRDLFARAHDLIAQASHPGHMGMKVAEALNFLKFHYEDFKRRGEGLAKQIEQEDKAELSQVDVADAKAAVEATLSDEHGSAEKPMETPKA
jgi:hypothetical protein